MATQYSKLSPTRASEATSLRHDVALAISNGGVACAGFWAMQAGHSPG